MINAINICGEFRWLCTIVVYTFMDFSEDWRFSEPLKNARGWPIVPATRHTPLHFYKRTLMAMRS
jgi:hypothetical protein